MKKSVDKVVITNLPSFYKINLYNEINKSRKILVIYTWDHNQGRNSDFYSGDMQFEYIHLNKGIVSRVFQLLAILRQIRYKELILSGWDSLPLWLGAFCSPKKKNAVVVESSYIESSTTGIKGFVKRVFMSRISKAYVSGKAQQKVVDGLGFNGRTIITKGVGVFNYIDQPPYEARSEVKTFLFVGRLIKVKNLHYLIERFNQHPELCLRIIGFGELEEELKSIANENIEFVGAVNNADLGSYFQAADVLILPSLSEVWGLVVEEALNNGTPVMVSNKVGCAEEIINDKNGVIFTLEDDDFEDKLSHICNVDIYNNMRRNIANMNFQEIEDHQVKCYL